MSRDRDHLPHPVTFFLTESERRRVLKKLRRIDRDRARALLVALGISKR
ncbi:MAG: hypothetical protein AAGB51_10390 [Planctomycetota bacterium]